MTDILAKATVEFMQPLIALSLRRPGKFSFYDENIEFIDSFKTGPEDRFAGTSIEFSDPIMEEYEVDILMEVAHYSGYANVIRLQPGWTFDSEIITIDGLTTEDFTFIIDLENLPKIRLASNETLLITFTVRRKESEEPKVSTIRDVVPVYLSQFDEFKGYVDAKLAYLEGSISGLIRKVADKEGKKDE